MKFSKKIEDLLKESSSVYILLTLRYRRLWTHLEIHTSATSLIQNLSHLGTCAPFNTHWLGNRVGVPTGRLYWWGTKTEHLSRNLTSISFLYIIWHIRKIDKTNNNMLFSGCLSAVCIPFAIVEGHSVKLTQIMLTSSRTIGLGHTHLWVHCKVHCGVGSSQVALHAGAHVRNTWPGISHSTDTVENKFNNYTLYMYITLTAWHWKHALLTCIKK